LRGGVALDVLKQQGLPARAIISRSRTFADTIGDFGDFEYWIYFSSNIL
jgi:hypothetical protein